DLLGELARGRWRIRQSRDQPDRHRFGSPPCAGGAADALGVNDIDALGAHQALEQAVVAAPRQWIDAVGLEWDPLAAIGLEIVDQRPLTTSDQRAGAGLWEHMEIGRASCRERGERGGAEG